jgi:hypothetical protein
MEQCYKNNVYQKIQRRIFMIWRKKIEELKEMKN